MQHGERDRTHAAIGQKVPSRQWRVARWMGSRASRRHGAMHQATVIIITALIVLLILPDLSPAKYKMHFRWVLHFLLQYLSNEWEVIFNFFEYPQKGWLSITEKRSPLYKSTILETEPRGEGFEYPEKHKKKLVKFDVSFQGAKIFQYYYS